MFRTATLRATAWWAATAASVPVAAHLTGPTLTAPATWRTSADAVLAAASVALIGCATWAWAVTSALLVEVLRARRGRVRPAPGVPSWVRRVVLGSCGAVLLGATAVPLAQAAPAGSLDDDTTGPGGAGPSISGLPYPDRALGPAQPRLPRAPAPTSGCEVVVRAGDSLWSIAAALDPPATDRELVADVEALHALNRDVVGPDPDLIHPGDRLRLPSPSPTTTQPDRCEESR